MDIIKKKSKKVSNVVAIYLKDKDMESLEFLREKDVNISMVCRRAIRETAQKLMKGSDISYKKNNLVVKVDGKEIINMEGNIITSKNQKPNQKPFFSKEEFEID